jgi:lipoprotein-releasing system permease protein
MGNESWATPEMILALVGAGVFVLAATAFVLATSVYKHVICLKYLFSGWKAVVPIASALPAAVGVFLLILVFAIMDGFANDTRQTARGTLADIIVDAHMEGLPYYDEFIRRAEKIDGVEVATPIIETFGIIKIVPKRKGYEYIEASVRPVVRTCRIYGIRPSEKSALGPFTTYLEQHKNETAHTADLLTVSPELRPAGGPPRSGCIAGVGLIGAPKPEEKPEIIQENAGWRALAWCLAGGGGIVLLFTWRAARRRPDRKMRRLAARVAGGATVALVAAALLVPVRPVEVLRPQVTDFRLIDYGGDLVVSTIPLSEKGGLQLDMGGVPRVTSRRLALADTFKSRFWENDASHLYVDFEIAQQMAGMEGQEATDDEPAAPARANQVQIKVRDPRRTPETIARLRQVWHDLATERHVGMTHLSFNTWEDQQRVLLNVVEMEKGLTVLMLSLMFLGFAILTALVSYVMAYVKSRDVGILKALGARDAGVGSLFLGYGFIIGLVGTAVGVAAALLMLQNLDAIELWVSQTLGVKVFPRDVYYFESIPQHLSVAWCVGVSASVMILSTVSSLAGGLLAAMKQPVEALRYE